MIKRVFLAALASVVVLCDAPVALAENPYMDLIDRRGRIVIGVKGDYPPFAALNASGDLEGFEIDLAQDIARRLGVRLQLDVVTSTNRLQKLDEGRVDLLIATLGDTAKRRELVTMVEPSYYSSGVNILAAKSSSITDWAQLRGAPICATRGALYNKEMTRRHLLQVELFGGNRDALLGLKNGICRGWMYDDVAIMATIREGGWDDYEMPLASTLGVSWSMAIHKNAAGTLFEQTLQDIVADWHRTGFLIERADAWDVRTAFLDQRRELWNGKNADGSPFCARQPDGKWNAECRETALLNSDEVSGFHKLALQIREATGLNITLLYDSQDRNKFGQAMLLSLLLVLATVAGSIGIGVVGGFILAARWPIVSHLLQVLVTVSRMTPPLLQLYLVFFGIGGYVAARYGWGFDAFVVAAVILSFYAGSANAVAIQEAILEQRRRRKGPLRRRDIGAVFNFSYSAIMASSVNVAKATGLAGTIAVPELINVTAAIVADAGNPDVMMNLLMLVYFLIVLSVVWLFSALRKYFISATPHG